MIDNGMFVFNPAMEWCGGGFASTSADLARWAKILFSGSAMEGDYLKIMTATPADASALLGPGARYGLGVIIRETELGPALGHDGGFPGYSSTTAYFPQHQISAAFMYNTDGRTALPDRRPYQVMIELVQIAVQKLNER